METKTWIVLDDDGKIRVRGFYTNMMPHYLRILADELEAVPEGIIDITWDQDLLMKE